jgi:hypothetical protein
MVHDESVRSAGCVAAVLLAASGLVFGQQAGSPPETFTASARAEGQDVSAAATVTIHIQRYTDERDVTAMQEALKLGGYPRLVPVLRKMPEVGYVELAQRKAVARWARQTPTDKGRTISIVTDRPIAFVGGAAVDAKPRAGYELAVVLLDVDATGAGTGSLAAAARIRPGGPTGVQIDDYAEQPIKLVVKRK